MGIFQAPPSERVETPLSLEQEERLSLIVETLSDCRDAGDRGPLERAIAENPDLASPLKELWAAMLVTDAVVEQSTIMQSAVFGSSPRGHGGPAVIFRKEVDDDADAGFTPGVSPLPATFGDYELLEELGRGGMGVVYRATQRSLGRTVAVKMLLRSDLATSADHLRFRSEAEAAARLDHPGIVSIYEVGERHGHPFYSMQFIDGTTLAKRLADGPIAGRDAARLLSKVADAVQAAHDGGVLHRDLKPSNILIDCLGEPHVTDFGLAKRLETVDSVTHTGAILGTPCYMSPEQAAGSRGDVTAASDVWSLGAILYQTLTGRPPFQAASPMDTLLAVLEADPPVPRSIRPDVDRDLEMIALKSLQKPQELRYQSANDLGSDLRAFVAGEPVAARRGGLADVTARLFRETHHAVVLENWGLLWMWHSVVVLALCVTTDVLVWQGVLTRWPYVVLWAGGLALWAPIFWALRHRTGPVTAVERQIAHVWAGSVIASTLLFAVEAALDLKPLLLSPVLALIAGVVFFAKAGILSGAFYIQAAVLFATSFLMCLLPDVQHVLFGLVSGACFFVPGLKYFRQRIRG